MSWTSEDLVINEEKFFIEELQLINAKGMIKLDYCFSNLYEMMDLNNDHQLLLKLLGERLMRDLIIIHIDGSGRPRLNVSMDNHTLFISECDTASCMKNPCVNK